LILREALSERVVEGASAHGNDHPNMVRVVLPAYRTPTPPASTD
jgi:hypothetical protein